jgi:hypothetical protein
MSDEIKVEKETFDRILGRMLSAKPLTKAEISARIKAEREAKKESARKFALEAQRKSKQYRNSKKLGQ